MSEEFKTLSPYYNAPDVSQPYAISGHLGLLSPATSVLSNFLYDKTPPKEKDTVCDRLKFI